MSSRGLGFRDGKTGLGRKKMRVVPTAAVTAPEQEGISRLPDQRSDDGLEPVRVVRHAAVSYCDSAAARSQASLRRGVLERRSGHIHTLESQEFDVSLSGPTVPGRFFVLFSKVAFSFPDLPVFYLWKGF
jgi:hypothetical protein